MDNYDLAVFFFYGISAISSVVQGIAGFGDAIILHLAWNVALYMNPDLHNTILGSRDVETIAILMSLRSVTLQAMLAHMTKKGFSKQMFTYLCPSQCISIVIGSWLLPYLSDAFLKPLLGGIFLVCGAIYMATKAKNYWHRRQEAEEEAKVIAAGGSPTMIAKKKYPGSHFHDEEGNIYQHILYAAVAAGTMSGLGQGLTGVGGPALMLFVLWYELPPNVARGTLPLSNFIAGIFRFVYTEYTGQYNWDAWLVYAALVVGGFIGLLVGNEIGRRISDRMFTVFLLSLLFLACLTMLGVSPFIVLALSFGNFVIAYFVRQYDVKQLAIDAEAAAIADAAELEEGGVLTAGALQKRVETAAAKEELEMNEGVGRISNVSITSHVSFDG